MNIGSFTYYIITLLFVNQICTANITRNTNATAVIITNEPRVEKKTILYYGHFTNSHAEVNVQIVLDL